jgi:hypothetical protein
MVACCPIPIWQFPYQVSSPNQKTHGCQLSSYLVPKVPNGPLSLNHLLYHLPYALSLGLSLPPSLSLVATTGRLPPPHFARRHTALGRRRAPTGMPTHPFLFPSCYAKPSTSIQYLFLRFLLSLLAAASSPTASSPAPPPCSGTSSWCWRTGSSCTRRAMYLSAPAARAKPLVGLRFCDLVSVILIPLLLKSS